MNAINLTNESANSVTHTGFLPIKSGRQSNNTKADARIWFSNKLCGLNMAPRPSCQLYERQKMISSEWKRLR